MTRATTSPERALLRSEGQFAELCLAINKPPVIYSARINQTFTSLDSVTQVTYDGGSGTLASVIPGMSMYVGTSAGACDLGIIRVRKDPTSTIIYINENSEIKWADNLYLTVVDEFNLWAKHLRVDDTTVYMDYEIDYTDQHSKCDPRVLMGANPVLELDPVSGLATYSPSAADSCVPGGWTNPTITGYSWTASGSHSISGGTTATPTITYNAAGQYRIACTVTTSDGKSSTGYRTVFVFDATHQPSQCVMTNLVGDVQTGGWSFDITMYDQAALSDVRDRVLVVLFAKTYYNGIKQYIGPVSGFENVLCEGWIEDNSIIDNPEQSSCTFHVQGPQYWLKKITGFPDGLEQYRASGSEYDTGSDGLNWLSLLTLDVDTCLWHFLHWRSTVDQVIDVYKTGDTRQMEALNPPAGNLWQQLDLMCNKTILAVPSCDRFGRLFINVDSQFLPVSDRTSIPVVMDLTGADWSGDIEITCSPYPVCGMLDASGISFDGNYYYSTPPTTPYTELRSNSTPLFSRSPGNVYKFMGLPDQIDNLLLVNQAQSDELCGLIAGQKNNSYPNIHIELVGINLFFDIAPCQYATLTILEGDTPRAINWDSVRIIPRRCNIEHDPTTGYLTIDWDFEAETFAENSVTITHTVTTQPPNIVGPGPGGGGGGGGNITPPVTSGLMFDFNFLVGNGSNVITTGIVGAVRVPYNCVIQSVEVVSPIGDGTIEFDIWRCSFSEISPGVHPVMGDSITGSNKPALSASDKSTTNLAGWSTTIFAGDWLFVNVDSASGITLATLACSGVTL